jgi:hypothetical protein
LHRVRHQDERIEISGQAVEIFIRERLVTSGPGPSQPG